MDSLTQAVLGAGVAGICAPQGQRRKALLAGAALGTLPDLDVIIRFDDAVKNFTYHRGFSHSLFVLLPFAALLWAGLRRWWAPAREAPGRWFAAIFLALLTHPLLDAHTAYGTQLFWPLTTPPIAWSTIFIIDPLFTLPLVVSVLLAASVPTKRWSTGTLAAGLAISATYMAWTWAAKNLVEQNAAAELANRGLSDAPVFSTPAPFNTALWRIVVMTDAGYLEGYDSLLVDERGIDFRFYASDFRALDSASHIWAVSRLRWFARDFVKAEVRDDVLILSDLRMGAEPKYAFRHIVAKRGNPHWTAMPTQLLQTSFDRGDVSALWHRIWGD